MSYFKNIIPKFQTLDKRKKIYVVILFVILAVLSWAFISAGIITGSFNRAQIKNGPEQQKVNAEGIIITETKDGTKYFEIYGENGNYDNKDKIARLNNVIGNFYKNNEVYMSFQSSKGEYDEKEKSITLYENTYIVLQNDTSLEANKLIWGGSDKDTVAEGHVRIKRGKDMIAIADKCIIGANYDKFKIIGNTKTKVFGKDKE
ncbi:MAG: LPS export ABC transporter periplasmic protein LptC [bacterium]|nr:LPS export ABC transporter periplasmic protein LptC [bacterium]